MRPILLGPICACLFLANASLNAPARARDRDWVGAVVTRISEVDRKGARAERSGLVTIRVRIDAEGALDGVSIDESSGFPELDERAIRAVQAAAPFGPPPKRLLSLEGYTELSFPLQFEARRGAGADARTP